MFSNKTKPILKHFQFHFVVYRYLTKGKDRSLEPSQTVHLLGAKLTGGVTVQDVEEDLFGGEEVVWVLLVELLPKRGVQEECVPGGSRNCEDCVT